MVDATIVEPGDLIIDEKMDMDMDEPKAEPSFAKTEVVEEEVKPNL